MPEKHQEEKVVDLLTATLEEEKQTDLKLTDGAGYHACRGRRCGRGIPQA
jgi:ferritin-like metal-binding protein YciE